MIINKSRVKEITKALSKKKLECLFLIGLITIIATNFSVSIRFGCYFLGVSCMLFATYLEFIANRGDE